jgi:ankyrin repeat protein
MSPRREIESEPPSEAEAGENELDQESSSEESGSDDEDDDKHQDVGESPKDLLVRILEGIRTGSRKFATYTTAERERLADLAGDPWGNRQNALHFLASLDKKEIPKKDSDFEVLVRYLIEHPSDFLAKQDRHGCTPLYYAIDSKKESMIRTMCDAHKDINSVLGIVAKDEQNCIHQAVTKRVKCLKLLIEKASGKTLSAKDKHGNTPLHLAVAYKWCREGQLEIVELLAEKSDPVVRATPNGDFNNADQSPYRYHVASHQKEKDKEAAKEAKERESVESKRRMGDEKEVSSRKTNSAKPVGPGTSTSSSAKPDTSILPPTANSGAPYAPRITIPDIDRTKFGEPNQSGASTPGPVTNSYSIPALDMASGTKPSKRPHSKDQASESTSKTKIHEPTVKDVERFLRLHYLRSRHYQDCMEILYGRNAPSGSELCFDLPGYSSMKQSEFDNLLSKLKFADILQYVGIPKVTLDLATPMGPNTSRARSGGRSSKFDGDGRSDLVYVFNQLRAKGVKTVLKVIVDDLQKPSHSEDAIEEALKGLGIEIWDWKRPDLCSEVIYNVAPKAREVHLHWSGNNAVLRGWAEERGLKRLTELRDLHLSVEQVRPSNPPFP